MASALHDGSGPGEPTRLSPTLGRRAFLAGSAGALLGGTLPFAGCRDGASSGHSSQPVEGRDLSLAEAGQAPVRRNVILIVADDLGYGDLSCAQPDRVHTPFLDALAHGGVRFTSAYVPAPLCSPSRAGLLTGRYPQRFGHEFNPGPAERCEADSLGLPNTQLLLSDLCKSAGHVTGAVGKWHLGSRPQFHPLARCFDEFFGFLHGDNLYLDPTDCPDLHTFAPPGYRAYPIRRGPYDTLYRGRSPVVEQEYLTDAFTREALAFIDRHASRPFFLYLAYNAPHLPLQVTDRYYQRFAHVPDPARRIYQAMVAAVDDGVGAILRKLEQTGLLDETLVVFLSDNGCLTGANACYNDPWNGGKLFLFEGGVRVPLMMRCPGVLPAGAIVSQPVSSLDLVPTVAHIAGLTLPPSLRPDGVNLCPHVLGEAKDPAHPLLFWRLGTNSAVRKGRYKLLTFNRTRELLFDLDLDPTERTDLSGTHPQIIKDLRDEYARWEKTLSPPRWPGLMTQPFSLQPFGHGPEKYPLWV